MSARVYIATGPRTLDDRVLQTLHSDLNPWDADLIRQALRGTAKDGGASLADIEAALGRLMAAGRVKVAESEEER